MAPSYEGPGTAIHGPAVGEGNLAPPKIRQMLQVPRLYGVFGVEGLGFRVQGLGVWVVKDFPHPPKPEALIRAAASPTPGGCGKP